MSDLFEGSPTWRKWAEAHVEKLRADRLEAIEQRRALMAGEVHTYSGSGAGMVDCSMETVRLYERSIVLLDETIAGYEAELEGDGTLG